MHDLIIFDIFTHETISTIKIINTSITPQSFPESISPSCLLSPRLFVTTA